jgi:DNA-binding transcriptional MerR regulator
VSDGRWSIGQLARTSGVTVRTLYYYDEIGLVSPSERTPAGHRRYTEDDVRRLYRVRALTQLGLSLEEVAAVLGRGTEDLSALRDLLHAQLADLDAKSRRLVEVRQQVLGLIERLDGAVMPEPERFLAALELAAPFHAHFSARQRDALAERRAELGADTIDALRAQWLAIIAELHEHRARGTPVEDPEVQELAAGWRRIGDTFRTGGEHLDEELGDAAKALWQEHRTHISKQLSDSVDWLAPDDMANIVDYVRRAWHAGPNER